MAALDVDIRHGTSKDIEAVEELYRATAQKPGGIARAENEIARAYIQNWVQSSLDRGVWLVAQERTSGQLIGSIHAFSPEPAALRHVLSTLTIVVHPQFQSQGIGRSMFQIFLEFIRDQRPEILRVELIARESNLQAIHFYESLGYRQEGRFEKRIRSVSGGFEADIPMAWLRS